MDDRALATLLTEMIRAGIVPEAVVDAAADECRARGDTDAAHELDCLTVAAVSEPAVQFVRRQARRRLRIVPDGGNTTT